MDKTLAELIFDDTRKLYSSDQEETLNFVPDRPSLSDNCVRLPFDIDHSPKEINANEICPTSDSLVQQQQNTPISNKDHQYRIHVGTQPGYYMEGRITFTESEKLHSKIIDVLENFLTSSNVSYKIIKKDAFSNSAWGLEPYACMPSVFILTIMMASHILLLLFQHQIVHIYKKRCTYINEENDQTLYMSLSSI